MKPLLICLALVTGCRSWDARALDAPFSPQEPRLMAATDSGGLSVWVVIALVAADVAIGVLIQQARHY